MENIIIEYLTEKNAFNEFQAIFQSEIINKTEYKGRISQILKVLVNNKVILKSCKGKLKSYYLNIPVKISLSEDQIVSCIFVLYVFDLGINNRKPLKKSFRWEQFTNDFQEIYKGNDLDIKNIILNFLKQRINEDPLHFREIFNILERYNILKQKDSKGNYKVHSYSNFINFLSYYNVLLISFNSEKIIPFLIQFIISILIDNNNNLNKELKRERNIKININNLFIKHVEQINVIKNQLDLNNRMD